MPSAGCLEGTESPISMKSFKLQMQCGDCSLQMQSDKKYATNAMWHLENDRCNVTVAMKQRVCDKSNVMW